jgi:hypothetical protein
VREFLLEALNTMALARPSVTLLQARSAGADRLDPVLERPFKAFETRAESARRDVLLDITTHLLADDAAALRRARAYVTHVFLAPILVAFDSARSDAATMALIREVEIAETVQTNLIPPRPPRLHDDNDNNNDVTDEDEDVPEDDNDDASSSSSDDGFASMTAELARIERAAFQYPAR